MCSERAVDYYHSLTFTKIIIFESSQLRNQKIPYIPINTWVWILYIQPFKDNLKTFTEMKEKIQIRKSNADRVKSASPKKINTYPKINLGYIPMEVISKSGKVIDFK